MNLIAGFIRARLTLGSAIRLTSVLATSLCTALGVIYANHYSYWEVTIRRTQTVDFNILANLLPTKASILLPQSQASKASAVLLQQALDSNYGLFGIIVTDCKSTAADCPEQKFLFASHAKIHRTEQGIDTLIPQNEYAKIWTQKLEPSPAQELASSPYILLYDPPPLRQEWSFPSPRNDTQTPLQKNQGTIIGRIYLLRASAPSFANELQRWLRDVPSSLAAMGSHQSRSSIGLQFRGYLSISYCPYSLLSSRIRLLPHETLPGKRTSSPAKARSSPTEFEFY
jgi:hypothetical protein